MKKALRGDSNAARWL